MPMAKWALGVALVYVFAAIGSSFLSSEVVTVETRDERGGTLTTSLWVVDVSGDTWVRATDPDALWLERLRANPQVAFVRDDDRSERRALIVDGVARKIDTAMREKYGRADQIAALFRDPGESVVVRLDAADGSSRWGEVYP